MANRLLIRQSQTRRLWSILGQLLVVGLFSVWLVVPLRSAYSFIAAALENGAGGYSSVFWGESALIQHLRSFPLEGKVYSNAPDAIYVLTGFSAAVSPRKYSYASPNTPTNDLDRLERSLVSEGDTYLVWFDDFRSANTLFGVSEIRARFNIEVVASKDDGAVYIFKPALAGDSSPTPNTIPQH